MKHIFAKIFSTFFVFVSFVSAAMAQNLYINDIRVYYPYGNNNEDAYCSYNRPADLKPGSRLMDVSAVLPTGDDIYKYSAKIEFDQPISNLTHSPKLISYDAITNAAAYKYFYPNSCLLLCASVQCTTSTTPISFGVDEMNFEVFKFGDGTNPLDPSSAPSIKTISLFNLGNGERCTFAKDQDYIIKDFGTFCAAWDGSYNLVGDFGKTNGNYGFRARVKTSQQTSQGTQIDIEQTSAYPGQNQMPINVDVVDIHNVISSVTAVGKSVVAAQPYNFKYQLSKDATVSIKVYDADAMHGCDVDDTKGGIVSLSSSCNVKTIINSEPKVGEGNTNTPLANADYWDGLDKHGQMLPAGSYLVAFSASANDEFGKDVALGVTRQMTLDPLQITDVSIKPLGPNPTEQANLGYVLTEDATVIVRIYQPGTKFPSIVIPGYLSTAPYSGHSTVNTITKINNNQLGNLDKLVREFVEVKNRRVTSITSWDGRDKDGNIMCDGDYVFAIYAVKDSQGTFPDGTHSWNGITTTRIRTGTIPILRGSIAGSFERSHTMLGSSPTVYGLAPFSFMYTPTRDTSSTLQIYHINDSPETVAAAGSSTTLVRTLIDNIARAGGYPNKEIWDGLDDNGQYVSSGTYLAQLTLTDPYTCAENRISTKTITFPVNLLRITDVETTPLLSAATAFATIGYTLSETMYVDINIYEPGTVVRPELWDPQHNQVEIADSSRIVYNINGVRPRRMHFSEPWDGKNNNGNMLADGVYPFVITAYTEHGGVKKYATDISYGFVTVARGKLIFNKFKVFPTIATLYNSSDTVRLPPYGIEYSLSRQSSVTINVVDWQDSSTIYAEVIQAESRDADTSYTDYWDGKCTRTVTSSPSGLKCSSGDFVEDGYYKILAIAEDADQEESLRQPATQYFVTDIAPLQIYDVAIKEVAPDSPGLISYQVSEPMKVVTKIYEPGTVIRGGGIYTESSSNIVKRIIGTKSARVAVEDVWDGTDLTMFPVDDGTYVFTIYGTTVTTAVDGIYGTLSTGTIRTDYDSYHGNILTYTIPVTRSGSIDVCGSFEKDSYFAPNPYIGNDGWFRIPVKATGYVSLSIYNLAGDMVYSKSFGKRGADQSINGKGKCSNTNHAHEACWPKVNNSGKELARGVYFAVLRFEAADGSRAICQTVKKILIP